MNIGWIVSQLDEPVNDLGFSENKGGALSKNNQAVPYFSTYLDILEFLQMEE
jgi:hypothetical protein